MRYSMPCALLCHLLLSDAHHFRQTFILFFARLDGAPFTLSYQTAFF